MVKAHRRYHTKVPIIEARALIRQLGGEPAITDAIATGKEDYILDLNYPLEDGSLTGAFDLIVDPGTIEHCFNVAQAFDNIDCMLAPEGFVYHQAAAAFPNHGFWSISPTAFFDFYESRGYELGRAYYWDGAEDSGGLIPRLVLAAPYAERQATPNLIASYVFRKRRGVKVENIGYPMQRIYSTARRALQVHDFIARQPEDGGEDPYNDKMHKLYKIQDALQKRPTLRRMIHVFLPLSVRRALHRVLIGRN